MPRNLPTGNDTGVAMGNGGVYSHVEGTELKQVNVPIETALGAVNGGISGGILATLVSASVSVVQELSNDEKTKNSLLKTVFRNVKSTHFLPIVIATAAFAAIGATVRFSRASAHNDWSERQFALQEQQVRSHAEKLEAEEKSPAKAR